jgi:hypothetical protein
LRGQTFPQRQEKILHLFHEIAERFVATHLANSDLVQPRSDRKEEFAIPMTEEAKVVERFINQFAHRIFTSKLVEGRHVYALQKLMALDYGRFVLSQILRDYKHGVRTLIMN